MLTLDSEREPSITYRWIKIFLPFNTLTLCINPQNKVGNVLRRHNRMIASQFLLYFTYIEIIISELLARALYINGQNKVGNVL